MSFKDFLDKSVIEEAVSSFKYTPEMKNLKDMFDHISKWKNRKYQPELADTKTINIYDNDDKLLGTIKDKGKIFMVDNGLSKDKTFKSYIEKGL